MNVSVSYYMADGGGWVAKKKNTLKIFILKIECKITVVTIILHISACLLG